METTNEEENFGEFGNGPTSIADEFVSAATFLFPDEAEVATALLRSCGTLCYLANEHTLAKVWPWNLAVGGLRLMVPASCLEEVREILSEVVSEEDVMAQAGFDAGIASTGARSDRIFAQGRNGGRVRAILGIAVLCAPAVDAIRVFSVGR